jgi:hypothetical protein
MGLFDLIRRIDRRHWFLCYTCLQQTNHDALRSVFHYVGPPVVVLGRQVTQCPRCKSTNTVSFQQLKEEGSQAQLWGLERLVRQHPRSQFEVTKEQSAGVSR